MASDKIADYQTTWRQITFMKKRADLTVEQFQKHWFTTHVQVVTALPIFREKVLQYEQLYCQDGLGLDTIEIPGEVTYDGIVVLDFRCKEDWEALVNSEEYKAAGMADVVKFTDPSFAKRVLVRRERQVPARS